MSAHRQAIAWIVALVLTFTGVAAGPLAAAVTAGAGATPAAADPTAVGPMAPAPATPAPASATPVPAPAAPACAPAAPEFTRPEPPARWLTDYERSGGVDTPRYAETVAYCRRLAEASRQLRYETFGVSPQGRELPLLIAERRGRFTPEAARRAGNAVVLIQACIHAGEPDGKDAGLMLLRDLAVIGSRQPPLVEDPRGAARPGAALAAGAGLPEGVTVLFIPIFSVDGHERFGPHNRINQNGPRETGWRTTARGLNLNRDHIKADAPEMQAWLRLFQRWRPDFVIDCHVTDGADYQYVLTYGMNLREDLDPGLAAWSRDAFLARLLPAMAARGLPLSPYVMFRKWGDPRSGLRAIATPPRFSDAYAPAQNRPALLVETHMFKDYRTRVEGTYQLLRETLALLAAERTRLCRLVAAADSATASPAFRARPFPLGWRTGPDSVMVDFLGRRYEVATSDLTGGEWVRYGPEPQTWRLPYFHRPVPKATVDLPEAYLIPPEWSDVIERLQLHGVALRRLERPATLTVTSSRLLDPRWAEQPYEGRHPLTCAVEDFVEERTFPAGTAVVDLAQRAARVIVHALEARSEESFLAWGFFDTVFEQKEYAENYVMEARAREMLAADPALAAEFAAQKAADPAFAADQQAILDWFFRRTPYWDARIGVYPVAKVTEQALIPR